MENPSQQILNNIGRNVEVLATMQGVPGAALDGLLRLSQKDGEHYNTPKAYRTKRTYDIDFDKVQTLSALFGTTTEVIVDIIPPKTSAEAPPFSVRLSDAVKQLIKETGIPWSRLPKFMGKGKGKGITLHDIELALNPDLPLPEANKLRVICRKLSPSWFFLHSIEDTAPNDRRETGKEAEEARPEREAISAPDEESRPPAPEEHKPTEPKKPVSAKDAFDEIEGILADLEGEFGFPLQTEVRLLEKTPLGMAVARGVLNKEWENRVGRPMQDKMFAPDVAEGKKKLAEMMAVAPKQGQAVEPAPAPVPAPPQSPSVHVEPKAEPTAKSGKKIRPLLFSRTDIARAVSRVKELAARTHLRDYGLFLLAGIPLKTGSISNMDKPSFWTGDKVNAYAQIFGVTPQVVLGEAPIPTELERNFGKIYAEHFEEAVEEVGYDISEVISIHAKITNKKASNCRAQMKNGIMPNLDDARNMTTIAGIRMVDILNWQDDWIAAVNAPSKMERLIDDIPQKEYVVAPNFATNLKNVCKEEGITAQNLLWAIGVVDIKRRRSLSRSKTIPRPVLETAAKALGVSAEAMANEADVGATPGIDFGQRFADAIQKAMSDSMMDWGLLANLAAISPAAPAGMSASKLHEKIMYDNPLARGGDSFLLGLTYALQMPLSELLEIGTQASDAETDADTVLPEGEEAQQLSIESVDQAAAEPQGQARTTDPISEETLDYYLDEDEKEMEVPPSKRSTPQYVTIPVGKSIKDDGSTMQIERRFKIASIPDGVSFAEAIKGHMLRPRPGQFPWNKIKLAAAACEELPDGLYLSDRDIEDFMNEKRVPLEDEVNAIVRAFYPGIGDDEEALEKAKARFYVLGFRGFNYQSTVPGTPDYGMSNESGAVLSVNLRKALRLSGENITSVADKLAGDGTQKGFKTWLLNMLWNLCVSQSPTKRDINGIASICGTTSDELRSLPKPHIKMEDLPDILAKMKADQIDRLYNQGWLAGYIKIP